MHFNHIVDPLTLVEGKLWNMGLGRTKQHVYQTKSQGNLYQTTPRINSYQVLPKSLWRESHYWEIAKGHPLLHNPWRNMSTTKIFKRLLSQVFSTGNSCQKSLKGHCLPKIEPKLFPKKLLKELPRCLWRENSTKNKSEWKFLSQNLWKEIFAKKSSAEKCPPNKQDTSLPKKTEKNSQAKRIWRRNPAKNLKRNSVPKNV